MNPGRLDGRTVVIANPSPDVYGSDLQMLESISAVVDAGGRAVVTLPRRGALCPLIEERGGTVELLDFPVLRRANQSLLGLARMGWEAAASVPRIVAYLRRRRPDVVYVNTVTLPWWLLAARIARVPALCHLHEAETTDSGLVRRLLIRPLRLATAILVISNAAMSAMSDADPALTARAHLVYNGVPQPPQTPEPPRRDNPLRLVVVGRLSPRKAPHLALEAVGQLRQQGYPLHLELAGSAFEGYEWYVAELEERASRPDLAGAVTFAGYCKPIWPNLAAADIVLAPSLREPFGNAVVEAQLSLRPVVATAALGHLESITDGVTGLLVPAGDIEAMAAATRRLIDDPALAQTIGEAARANAQERFSTQRYEREVVDVIAGLAR